MNRRKTEKHIREYFQSPLLGDVTRAEEPRVITEFRLRGSDPEEYSIFQFETYWEDGDIQNILPDYLGYLDKPEYIVRVEFDEFAANHFAFRPHSVSKWFYGTTTMTWVLFMLNDIQHDSDLTHQFLKAEGLRAFTMAGFQALNKIKVYKRRIETQIGRNAFYSTSD